VLRFTPRMHRHQLAPLGVKRRAALAMAGVTPSLLVQPLTQKTNLLPPSGAPGASLLQAKTGWSTPHVGCSIEDGGQGNPRIAVFLDLHDGMVAACLSLPGTLQFHHLWDAVMLLHSQ